MTHVPGYNLPTKTPKTPKTHSSTSVASTWMLPRYDCLNVTSSSQRIWTSTHRQGSPFKKGHWRFWFVCWTWFFCCFERVNGELFKQQILKGWDWMQMWLDVIEMQYLQFNSDLLHILTGLELSPRLNDPAETEKLDETGAFNRWLKKQEFEEEFLHRWYERCLDEYRQTHKTHRKVFAMFFNT